MNKHLYFCIFICLQNTSLAYAQRIEKDTTLIRQATPDKEKIQLNPEVLKAIEAGTLISTDIPSGKHSASPSQISITKDFSEYVQPDDSCKEKENIYYQIIPPKLFKLHGPQYEADKDKGPQIDKNAFTPHKPLFPKKEFKVGETPITIAAGAENLFLDEVKDGQKRGSINGKVRFSFSLEDILQQIFSPKERAKKRNQKRAKAWKY